ncbi:Uncharacterised protein [Bordetella pertussis]|nr:Uncharacterised protein [Bordetella pertussis]
MVAPSMHGCWVWKCPCTAMAHGWCRAPWPAPTGIGPMASRQARPMS